jgi:hypothetical protein
MTVDFEIDGEQKAHPFYVFILRILCKGQAVKDHVVKAVYI